MSATTLVTSPANRLRAELAIESGSLGGSGGGLAGVGGQRGSVDGLATGLVAAGGQAAVVDPASDGVIADTE